MEREVIGWIAIGALFVLLVLRVPVAVALMSIGFVGYWAVAGLDPALRILGVIPYSKVATYSFTVVPLFIIMGHFAYHAGFAADLFRTAQRWVGSMPGGLVQATIVGATGFGAASGSGLASCAIISKLAVPGMIQQGVQRPLAFGAVAAASSLMPGGAKAALACASLVACASRMAALRSETCSMPCVATPTGPPPKPPMIPACLIRSQACPQVIS